MIALGSFLAWSFCAGGAERGAARQAAKRNSARAGCVWPCGALCAEALWRHDALNPCADPNHAPEWTLDQNRLRHSGAILAYQALMNLTRAPMLARRKPRAARRIRSAMRPGSKSGR